MRDELCGIRVIKCDCLPPRFISAFRLVEFFCPYNNLYVGVGMA
jgi:hypothetical protein